VRSKQRNHGKHPIVRACPKSGRFRNWLGGESVSSARSGSYSHFDAAKLLNPQILGTLLVCCPPLEGSPVRYAASRKVRDSFFGFLSLANIHKLCVNTPHANASSRWSNPLARIGRPRNPCLRMPIRASVRACRRCNRANFLPFILRLNSAGCRGHSPSKVPPSLRVRLLEALANPRSVTTAPTWCPVASHTRNRLPNKSCYRPEQTPGKIRSPE
jgi:hypothetical protein